MINIENLKKFIEKFPLFFGVAEKLNANSIDWMIGGSGCLFLLGNERLPDDVDVFLPDEQHDKADKIFGIELFTHTSKSENVRNSNPDGDHSIQLTSHLEFNFDKHYYFGINDAVKQKRIKFQYEGLDLYLLPVEDVLLIKALLQRGLEENKFDIEDIEKFMKIYRIDPIYLNQRIKELDAESRVGDIFKRLGYLK